MKKIVRKDLENILLQFKMPISTIDDMKVIDIYHISNWDHTIKFWDEEVKRNENPPLREFYFDFQEMLIFIKIFLNQLPFSQAILASRYGGRFIGYPYGEEYKPCVNEITKWLHKNNMRINSSAGLLLNREELMNYIDMISECGFMGMSGLCVFIPEAGVVILAHHHMNYQVYTSTLEEHKTIIKEIIDSHEKLKMSVW